MAGLCAAQLQRDFENTIEVNFPDGREREVWMMESLPNAVPKSAKKVGGSNISLPLPRKADLFRVFVFDPRYNVIASKPLNDISSRYWTPTSKDYSYIGDVTLRLTSGPNVLTSANISVTDEAGNRKKAGIEVDAAGEVFLFYIAPGKLEVKVEYTKTDGTTGTKEQFFDVSLKDARETFPLEFVMDLPDAKNVIPNPDQQGAAAIKTSETNKPEENPIGRAFIFVIIAAFIVGALFFLAKAMMARKDDLIGPLTQMGVQLPEQAKPDPKPIAQVLDETVKPQPPEKIILDPPTGATEPITVVEPSTPVMASKIQLPEPEIVAPKYTESTVFKIEDDAEDVAEVIAPIAAIAFKPRLVSSLDQGVIDLPTGELLVGRDLGLHISLPTDPTVSRHHAKLVAGNGMVTVTDLGSTNGTYVNGSRAKGDVVLSPGDQVQFGAARYRFEA